MAIYEFHFLSEIHQIAVRNFDTLGFSGTAGGIYHVGKSFFRRNDLLRSRTRHREEAAVGILGEENRSVPIGHTGGTDAVGDEHGTPTEGQNAG